MHRNIFDAIAMHRNIANRVNAACRLDPADSARVPPWHGHDSARVPALHGNDSWHGTDESVPCSDMDVPNEHDHCFVLIDVAWRQFGTRVPEGPDESWPGGDMGFQANVNFTSLGWAW